jgi:hypothetical protein
MHSTISDESTIRIKTSETLTNRLSLWSGHAIFVAVDSTVHVCRTVETRNRMQESSAVFVQCRMQSGRPVFKDTDQSEKAQRSSDSSICISPFSTTDRLIILLQQGCTTINYASRSGTPPRYLLKHPRRLQLTSRMQTGRHTSLSTLILSPLLSFQFSPRYHARNTAWSEACIRLCSVSIPPCYAKSRISNDFRFICSEQRNTHNP